MAYPHFDVTDQSQLENWCYYRQRNRSGQQCRSVVLVESSADADRCSVQFVVVVSIVADADASNYTDLTCACKHFALADSSCLVVFVDFAAFAFAATTSRTAVFADVEHRYVR